MKNSLFIGLKFGCFMIVSGMLPHFIQAKSNPYSNSGYTSNSSTQKNSGDRAKNLKNHTKLDNHWSCEDGAFDEVFNIFNERDDIFALNDGSFVEKEDPFKDTSIPVFK